MKTCLRDHPQNTRNSYVNAKGHRICRVCVREKQRARYCAELQAIDAYQHRIVNHSKQDA